MNQFVREGDGLVYRRHGRGAAYRVTESQAQEFLDQYMRRTRVARVVLFLATIALGGGGALLLTLADPLPSNGSIAAWSVGLVAVLVSVFVWAEMRSQILPERELAQTAPVGPAIDKDEWTRAQLEQVPWINLAILPLMGFFIVWAFRGEVDLYAGWGRVMWLIPAACVLLASVQAVRKWRSRRAG